LKTILERYGVNEGILKEHEEKYNGLILGRITEEHKGLYKVITNEGKFIGKVSGKYVFNSKERGDYPAVGDWVALQGSAERDKIFIIEGLLTRKSKLSRKVAGRRSDEQVIAANIDYIFICMALNNDFNLKRLDRYITLAWNSGAIPVILLTKADLCSELEEKLDLVKTNAPGIDIIAVSTFTGMELDSVKSYISEGITVGFVGSSGVGKSTLINYLLGYEKQLINGTRDDDKGRHTTTYRELIALPQGGVVIDTPGMREIHLLDETEGLEASFEDIEGLARKCRFSDCQHNNEPGCAVIYALQQGELSRERFESYLKLKKEAEYMERKMDKRAEREYRQFLAKRHKSRNKIIY